MHLRLLVILSLIVLIFSCSKSKCPSDADWQANAKPIYFTDQQKSRIPYRNINKITFLLNDTQTVVFINSIHNDYFDLVCSDGEICKTCNTKNEEESHVYVSNGFPTIHITHRFIVQSINNPTDTYLYLDMIIGNYEGGYNSNLLDSISYNFKDSLTVNNKTYYNIHLLAPNFYDGHTSKVYFDSVLYTKDVGIIKIIDSNHNKFELIKVE